MSQRRPRYILNHVYGSVEDLLLNPLARDNASGPYIKLRDRCAELGYTFEGVSDQDLADCRWLLFWDAWGAISSGPLGAITRAKIWRAGGSPRNILREALRRGMAEKLVLFMYEPPSICPQNFDPRIQEQFEVVFTWDPNLVDDRKFFRIYLPSSPEHPPMPEVLFSDKKLLVDISSFKFIRHEIERELNTERRRTIRFFGDRYPGEFDLFGAGWNPGPLEYLAKKIANPHTRYERYSSYRGTVRNKWDVLPRYKFALCYENIRDQRGYVSIKIFDCLRSGCVPIYLGAPDIDEYVDPEAFVDRRNFGSLQELAGYLAGIGQDQHEAYLEAGRAYLQSEKFKLFLDDNFARTVIRTLRLGEER